MPAHFRPANCLSHARFLDFEKDSQGKINGVVYQDVLTGSKHTARCRYAVNCAGPWADELRLKDDPSVAKRIVLVAGSHITYDGAISSKQFGIAAPSADGRITLVIPWLKKIIVGTTETKLEEPTDYPACTEKERAFLSEAMLGIFDKLTPGELLGLERTRWSGQRPLVRAEASAATKDISRKHVIEKSTSGLLSLLGGKWTIYRRMGQDLVDLIAADLKPTGQVVPPSETSTLKLLGYAPNGAALRENLAQKYGPLGAYLYDSYGSRSLEILKGDLTRVAGLITRAEVQWLIHNEMAVLPEDILVRRTRLAFLESRETILAAIPRIVAIYAQELRLTPDVSEQLLLSTFEHLLKYEFD